jgi:hypothetical protein
MEKYGVIYEKNKKTKKVDECTGDGISRESYYDIESFWQNDRSHLESKY